MTSGNFKSFNLKPLVVARLFAEMTACLIVIALPVVAALPIHKYAIAPTTMAALILLAVGAGVLLPSYGFITYKVKVDDDGLQLLSAFKKQVVAWQQMQSLGLKTSFGWRRYVITTDGESASFPIWLANVTELVHLIRERLPNRGMSAAARERVFKQHPLGLVMQIGKLTLTIGFIGLFWYFFGTMLKRPPKEATDVAIIFGACVILTVLMLWRIWLIAFMPRRVEVSDEGLFLDTWFFKKPVAWSETKKVNAPPMILPEGELLSTKGGWILLSADLEAFDELQYEVSRRLQGSGLAAPPQSPDAESSPPGETGGKPTLQPNLRKRPKRKKS